MRMHWAAVAALLALPLLAGCDMKHPVTAPVIGGSGQLVVNEFMASNSSQGADEFGENDDWIEVYNGGDAPINLAGYGVTDDLTKPNKYEIPSGYPSVTTVPAHGYLLIWCDSQPDQGPLHTTFNLSAGGEQIGLYEPSGDPVSELTYGPQSSDISYGRTTDGADTWQFFTTPTPGASNGGGGGGGGSPTIATPTLAPAVPTAGSAVTVSAVITDDGTVTAATLYYAVGAGSYSSVTMTHVGTTWSGSIPGQASGATVHYYLSAVDDQSHTTTLPANAPTTTLSYTIGGGGGGVPVLYVNELLASNSAGLTDPYGEYDDWFEVYNPGDTPVDLGGMYVTDDLSTPNKWQIPATDAAATTVPAHGYLIVWADGQPDQGAIHVNLKLSAAGEAIGLYTAAGETIDTVTFGAQANDVSYARVPDGSANWVTLTTPTPGATNGTGIVAGGTATR